MFFAPEVQKTPRFEFNRPAPIVTGTVEYSGRRAPTQEGFHTFSFEQTCISLEGGRQILKLRKPLQLRIDPNTLRFTVKDWGIEMDYMHLPQLPKEVARRFLFLFTSAECGKLTVVEQADFLHVLDYVDFQQFSIDRSAPRYMEGILHSNSSVVIVEWHDGARQQLDWNVARALSEVNPGERFSAFVKLGKDDKPLSIERVLLFGSPEPKDEGWDSWPKKG